MFDFSSFLAFKEVYVTTNRIQRIVSMCAISTSLVLAAFSFLVFGSASAFALTHAAGASQTTSSTTASVARIVVNQQGATVFSPQAITVTSGATVRIVNKTPFTRFVGVNGRLDALLPGASLRINPTQSEVAQICGGGALTITVV
jgi:hypothetical protein